jgi:hypothetical protein
MEPPDVFNEAGDFSSDVPRTSEPEIYTSL